MNRTGRFLAGTLLLFMGAGWGKAAASDPAPAAAPGGGAAAGWRHEVALYLLAAGLDGEVTVRGLDADVDVSFSDIMENLEAGGMAAYRGTNGRWAVMANGVFMGLGATKDGRLGGRTDVDVDQAALEIDGTYRLNERLELLFGVRGRAIDVTAAVDSPPLPETRESADQRWIDPLVGLRVGVPMGGKWSFIGRGDIGGFGVGSDLAWQVIARFDWRITPRFGASFGYQILDEDFEEGDGADRFRYEVTTLGPVVGVTFSF